MDVVRHVDKVDAIVLVSGDGDFVDLLDYLRGRGIQTEVIAFGKTTSKKLVEEADEFLNLDETPGKFLIKEKSVRQNA